MSVKEEKREKCKTKVPKQGRKNYGDKNIANSCSCVIKMNRPPMEKSAIFWRENHAGKPRGVPLTTLYI